MRTRTLRTALPADVPEREKMDDDVLCPPHDFIACWGTPPDAANHDDTIPLMLCSQCGDVRALKLPNP